jgi:hypothetical protein
LRDSSPTVSKTSFRSRIDFPVPERPRAHLDLMREMKNIYFFTIHSEIMKYGMSFQINHNIVIGFVSSVQPERYLLVNSIGCGLCFKIMGEFIIGMLNIYLLSRSASYGLFAGLKIIFHELWW